MATTDDPPVADTLPRISRSIQTFVEHPLTKLAVGLILVASSVVETYYSFYDDLNQLRLRVHHGLLVLGFVNVLAAVPPLIEGLEHYLAFRAKVPTLRGSKKTSDSSRP